MDEKNRREDEVVGSTGWDAPSNTPSSGLAGTAEGIRNTPPSENNVPMERPDGRKEE